MSVNAKMTAIADAIREKTGKTEALGLDAMAASVGEVYEAGQLAEHLVCAAEHFTTSLFGSGTQTLVVDMPFYPDVIIVYGISPYLEAVGNAARVFMTDTRSCGKRTAFLMHLTSAKADGAKVNSNEISTILGYADGKLTINIANFSNVGTWNTDTRYAVSAVRFPNETAKWLIEEQVALLPNTVPSGNSGVMQYRRQCIESLFETDEWAALIGTKPNWTFSML